MGAPLPVTDDEKRDAVAMYLDGHAMRDVCRRYRRTDTTIRKWVKAAGHDIRPAGEAAPSSKVLFAPIGELPADHPVSEVDQAAMRDRAWVRMLAAQRARQRAA